MIFESAESRGFFVFFFALNDKNIIRPDGELRKRRETIGFFLLKNCRRRGYSPDFEGGFFRSLLDSSYGFYGTSNFQRFGLPNFH